MVSSLSIFMVQMNATVGAIESNAKNIEKFYLEGKEKGADLVVTPELSLVGYPPEDLVLKPFLIQEARKALIKLAAITKGGPGLLVGLPVREEKKLYNAIVFLENGSIAATRYKHDLPNYGVFDEKRLFDCSPVIKSIFYRDFRLGAMICEDMWQAKVTDSLVEQGIDFLLVPTCSPFSEAKHESRLKTARLRVKSSGVPLLFCNQVGGQDELVFDGASFILDGEGQIVHQMPFFEEATSLVTLKLNGGDIQIEGGHLQNGPDRLTSLYSAAVLGLRDYCSKNNFPGIVLGLSGGIDSALSASIAVDALGADNVKAVMLPSEYTSSESLEDAALCAKNLGVSYDVISINPNVKAMEDTLSPLFSGHPRDTTEENIQSRLRGVILMALSNKFGHMVLTTGNKSEVSVGYSTLYGDMCGGFNAIKDIYKMDVFALSNWRNQNRPDFCLGPDGLVIPERIISKPPTAELSPDQRDDDNLPPYSVLDPILRGLVEDDLPVSDLIARGYKQSDVERVEHLLYTAEYKRRQAAPGVKVGDKLFGRDRRYPITNGFRTARFKDT